MAFDVQLQDGLTALGLPYSARHIAAFNLFYTLVSHWNRRHNLTRIADESEFIEKHLLDSLLLVPYLTTPATVIDIGSGAGFPGIPLAIYLRELQVVLVESQKKKVAFLAWATSRLKLATTVWDTHLHPEELRARYQTFEEGRPLYCVSRATMSLTDLITLTAPLIASRASTTLLAMKGPNEEDTALNSLLLKNHLQMTRHGPLVLPISGATRVIYEITNCASSLG